jgi:hypothetical protein
LFMDVSKRKASAWQSRFHIGRCRSVKSAA